MHSPIISTDIVAEAQVSDGFSVLKSNPGAPVRVTPAARGKFSGCQGIIGTSILSIHNHYQT